MPKNSVPAYRPHKATGQARVIIAGKTYYLGKYGSEESQEKYGRLIAEWKASNRTAAPKLPTSKLSTSQPGILIVELVNAYWKWAQGYYLKDGTPTDQQHVVALAMREIKRTYSLTPAEAFGPLALRAVQQQMIDSGKTRGVINQYTGIIKRMFKWAASHEMLPVTAFQGLATVPGLKRGRTTAREPAPIMPVDDATVEATLEHLPQVIADMVRLHRLIGCRPGEVCGLRPCDVDSTGEVWTYTPESHKTEHHGRQRKIFIGPKAQGLLRPYLLRDKTAHCFAPVDSERKRRADQRKRRKTRVQPSQVNRAKAKPTWKLRDRYDKDGYCRAIVRAADKSDAAAKKQAAIDGITLIEGARLIRRWHPNQLRHCVATSIRKQFGIEAAQTVLGHSKANVTEIYAERDFGLAARVMKEVG